MIYICCNLIFCLLVSCDARSHSEQQAGVSTDNLALHLGLHDWCNRFNSLFFSTQSSRPYAGEYAFVLDKAARSTLMPKVYLWNCILTLFQHLSTFCFASNSKEIKILHFFPPLWPSSSSLINFLLFTRDILLHLSWQFWQENEKEKKSHSETPFWLKTKQPIDASGRRQVDHTRQRQKQQTAKLNGHRLRPHFDAL